MSERPQRSTLGAVRRFLPHPSRATGNPMPVARSGYPDRMRRLTALALLLALILTGCTAPAPQPTATPTSTPEAERTEVDWTQYPPDAQRLIDEAETAGDCEALQGTFDVAADAGFLDQMTYIDEALRLADCY